MVHSSVCRSRTPSSSFAIQSWNGVVINRKSKNLHCRNNFEPKPTLKSCACRCEQVKKSSQPFSVGVSPKENISQSVTPKDQTSLFVVNFP